MLLSAACEKRNAADSPGRISGFVIRYVCRIEDEGCQFRQQSADGTEKKKSGLTVPELYGFPEESLFSGRG